MWANIVLMLAQCLQRWPNIKTTSAQCLVLSAMLRDIDHEHNLIMSHSTIFWSVILTVAVEGIYVERIQLHFYYHSIIIHALDM